MFNAKLKERLRDAEALVRSLEAFVFVAKTDGTKSKAVEFADNECRQYREKWKETI